MHRFFEPVIRPLLDAVAPSVVVEIGSDHGLGTELLAQWCDEHGAMLHSVDPLPKYDLDEWSARWPGTLEFHRDLSLNALVDIGPADFVCIDGDHNWYTVMHELQLLRHSSAEAGQPFPLTLLHDVAWPYGRRDLYYDPETIPEGFRHPHRKGGIVSGTRGLVDRGFNDHLENAIHEGTPKNGVLTAAEDFVAESDGSLTLRVVPGLHGLGVISDSSLSKGGVPEFLDELTSESAIGNVLEAVERDRLERLQSLWKVRGDLGRERDRVSRLRVQATKADELKAKSDELRRQNSELRSAIESTQEELATARSHLKVAEERANRAEEWYRQAVVAHDQESQVLRSQSSASEADLTALRKRRSVRLALRAASLARPFFRARQGRVARRKARQVETDEGDSFHRSVTPRAAATDSESDVGLAPNILDLPLRAWALDGIFGTFLGRLFDSGPPGDFQRAWTASEHLFEGSDDSKSGASPLVSIIMPTYNRANVIGDAIASVLEQSYGHWELLICDDASDDETEAVAMQCGDPRIKYHRLPKGGAAAARNAGLARAQGDLIAYLDSDNIWHPQFLEILVSQLVTNRGRFSAYCKFIDVVITPDRMELKNFEARRFDYESLCRRNFIDLNSLVHRRFLYDHLGGFDERLVRQQDWDLILRYAYLQDPIYVDRFLLLYRRSPLWNQITTSQRDDMSSPVLIREAMQSAYSTGLPDTYKGEIPSVTVLSWDISRNHFSKAYNIAEAMAKRSRVQLLGFRFFDEPIFPPYDNADPEFDTYYLPGGNFPEWSSQLAKGVANAKGHVLYAVKPRLPSLGLALLANYHTGKPIVLEINDLESVVTNPRSGDRPIAPIQLADVDPADPELRNPYGSLWTSIMESLAFEVPIRVTHNSFLDQHFGGGAFYLRNPKDETHFDPELYDRDETRRSLGFRPAHRVLLFGGMVRRHKGVFELARFVNRPGSRYRLLVVGARNTPDQAELIKRAGDRVRIVEPLDRNEMAAINLAADSVVLWLDPNVAASQYQMPFKLTDALAMKVPILANEIGDVGELGRQGFLKLVPFGDFERLRTALDAVFDEGDATKATVEAGRRLYLRQFSYSSVRRNMEMILIEAGAHEGTLPVAKEFAEFFSAFVGELEGKFSDEPTNLTR